jgi:hypothetical protein
MPIFLRTTAVVFLLTLFHLFPACIFCQEPGLPPPPPPPDMNGAIRIYVDCQWCDLDFIRQQMTFVNYVRDRTEAQVDILVTTQGTGGGGTEYIIHFIGQHEFTGEDDTLHFDVKRSETEEKTRTALLTTLKLGLVRYVARTPLADHLKISFDAPEVKKEIQDPWNYWVFSLSGNGNFNDEQTSRSFYLNGSFSANRVTNANKINLSVHANYSDYRYDYQDYSYTSISKGKGFSGLAVWSLTDHWSLGGAGSVNSSTYSNIDLQGSIAPAIEYDIFPYSESSRRQLRCFYKIPISTMRYLEETIYDKTSQTLVSEELSITLDQKEQWGSASIALTGSHYFYDLNRYNIDLFASVSLHLVEGLSLNLFGDASKPHDQIGLAKGTATEEELLLSRREFETQYRYWVSVGISYTFGSIFNNIVNPRFGNSGGGGTTIYFSN